MQDRLLDLLATTPNLAADDLLLEALRHGDPNEQNRALDVILTRRTARGTGGVLNLLPTLPTAIRQRVLADLRPFESALRDAARSGEPDGRIGALGLIVEGAAGRLAALAGENVSHADAAVATAAADALDDLSRQVADAAGQLRREEGDAALYDWLIESRDAVAAAASRTLAGYGGPHAATLVDALLRTCDGPGGGAMGVLSAVRHGGKERLRRRLEESPAADGVGAFLAAAAQGHLRGTVGPTLGRIEGAARGDLFERAHWLREAGLARAVASVGLAAAWEGEEVATPPKGGALAGVGRAADWVAAGRVEVGAGEAVFRGLLRLAEGAEEAAVAGRLRVVRALSGRAESAALLAELVDDEDERVARSAARALMRLDPPGLEATLLKKLPAAGPTVRRVIGRRAGRGAFEAFWERRGRMPAATRAAAGAALLKLLPDVGPRLRRKMLVGPPASRVEALAMGEELRLIGPLRDAVAALCRHEDARVRSRAVAALGRLGEPSAEVRRALDDPDGRVRSNAIEASVGAEAAVDHLLPLLESRTGSAVGRERANAIRALGRLRAPAAAERLTAMLRDARPDHRLSAMWALRQVGWWRLLGEVSGIARDDPDPRARRYAASMLKGVAGEMREGRKSA